MLRRFFWVAFFALLTIPVMCGQSGIPSQVDGWRIEVSPPGNEFYQPPESREDVPPPSDKVLRVIRIIAPQLRMDEWEIEDEKYYEIDAVAGNDEYQFLISSEGELIELEYENDSTDVEEEPDEMILKGTREACPATQVPRAALKTISEILPGTEPDQCWVAQTVDGRRYVIQVNSMVFYARPDGQISAAGLVDEGALNEISPPSEQS
ncbi:MAG TPA: hypothetical protein VKA68_07870, partial [bacterium]|nr:hypothetical protein [bacterium]